MNIKRSILALCCAATAWLARTALAEGIPEPGLLLYGSVTNTAGPRLLPLSPVQWTVTGGGSSASVVSTLVNVNGQFFYVARIPFETRAAGGVAFTPAPNTLPLSTQPTPFTKTVSVNGVPAILAPSAYTNFTFSKLDRGRIERVDLLVSLPGGPDR